MRILVDEDSQARSQLNTLRGNGHDVMADRPGHRGIMAVFRDAEVRKNMSHVQIAAAVRRLETSGVTVAGEFHVLNHWR